MVQMVPWAWRKTEWREVAGLAAGCAVMLPFGALALSVLDPAIVKKVIGLMTLSFVAMLWFGWRYKGPRNVAVRLLVGGVSGFTNGLTGIGAPPAILYFMTGERDIVTMRANLIIYFAFITLIAVPSFLYLGLVNWQTVGRWCVLTPPSLIGIAIGSRMFHGTSERAYTRAALAVLVVAAAVAFTK